MMILLILLQHLFYFIIDVRVSAINATKNVNIILFQHLFYFSARVRSVPGRD